MGCNKKVKRKDVVRVYKSAKVRKDYVENLEVLRQKILGSLHVNVTSWYEGCYKDCFSNTDQIRCLSNGQIGHIDKYSYVEYLYRLAAFDSNKDAGGAVYAQLTEVENIYQFKLLNI